VAQRKRAVKTPSSTTLTHESGSDLGMVIGSQPRGRRIETYHRYLFNLPNLQNSVVIVRETLNMSTNNKPLPRRAATSSNYTLTFVSELFDGYLFLIKRQAQDRYLWVVLTGMAQGQRAGLITPRSLDRNELPVSFQFGSFKETARGDEEIYMPVVECIRGTFYVPHHDKGRMLPYFVVSHLYRLLLLVV
jgi:hypothetical protein